MFCEPSSKNDACFLILCLQHGSRHTRVRLLSCLGEKRVTVARERTITQPLRRVIRYTRLLVAHHLLLHGVNVVARARARVLRLRETVPPAGM